MGVSGFSRSSYEWRTAALYPSVIHDPQPQRVGEVVSTHITITGGFTVSPLLQASLVIFIGQQPPRRTHAKGRGHCVCARRPSLHNGRLAPVCLSCTRSPLLPFYTFGAAALHQVLHSSFAPPLQSPAHPFTFSATGPTPLTIGRAHAPEPRRCVCSTTPRRDPSWRILR